MRQVTINIEDKDYDLFTQLLKRFDISWSDEKDEIPEHVKRLLDERGKNYDPAKNITLEELKSRIKSKYGF